MVYTEKYIRTVNAAKWADYQRKMTFCTGGLTLSLVALYCFVGAMSLLTWGTGLIPTLAAVIVTSGITLAIDLYNEPLAREWLLFHTTEEGKYLLRLLKAYRQQLVGTTLSNGERKAIAPGWNESLTEARIQAYRSLGMLAPEPAPPAKCLPPQELSRPQRPVLVTGRER